MKHNSYHSEISVEERVWVINQINKINIKMSNDFKSKESTRGTETAFSSIKGLGFGRGYKSVFRGLPPKGLGSGFGTAGKVQEPQDFHVMSAITSSLGLPPALYPASRGFLKDQQLIYHFMLYL